MAKSSTKLQLKKPNKKDLNNAYGQNNTTNTFNTTNSVSTYKPGKNVTNAYSALQKQMKNNPKFNSAYTQEMANAYNNYKNRKAFEYDMNKDALYQQYAKQYKALGNTAMQDTMGQAAQLSGGFGNSYATSAGQQAYNQYMQQLNDKVPELYAQARDVYNQEGQELLNQYDLAQQMYNRDYGKFRDQIADNNEKINQLYNIYNTNAANDLDQYKQMSNNNQFALNYALDKQNQAFNQKMQQAELNLKKQQVNADIASQNAANQAKLITAQAKALAKQQGKDLTKDQYERLEKLGFGNASNDSKFLSYLDNLEKIGAIDRDFASNLYSMYWGDYNPETEMDKNLKNLGKQSQSIGLESALKSYIASGKLGKGEKDKQAVFNRYYNLYRR